MINTEQSILVTGAAGFIGSGVASRLAMMGHHVVGYDNFNDYYDPQLKHGRVKALLGQLSVTCVKGDITDPSQLAETFERLKPTMVVHMAAQAGVRYSLDNPSVYVQSNLVGFANILEACRRNEVQHLLYASSSSVYGNNSKVPFREDDMTDSPVSFYASTKKSNELMAHSYSQLYGLSATGLRFFTVYGPWGRPDMACVSFIEKMMRGDAIPVFADGLLTRDLTYIDDIVESVVRILFKPSPATKSAPSHSVFNIGSQNPIRVLDLIQGLERVSGIHAKMEFHPMQLGDVVATCACTDKLKDWVDFVPNTALETGLSKFYEWYCKWRTAREALINS